MLGKHTLSSLLSSIGFLLLTFSVFARPFNGTFVSRRWIIHPTELHAITTYSKVGLLDQRCVPIISIQNRNVSLVGRITDTHISSFHFLDRSSASDLLLVESPSPQWRIPNRLNPTRPVKVKIRTRSTGRRRCARPLIY